MRLSDRYTPQVRMRETQIGRQIHANKTVQCETGDSRMRTWSVYQPNNLPVRMTNIL